MNDRNNKRLRFMDFCAGIGGGRLGLEKAGCVCVGYSEILKSSIQTYTILHDAANEQNYGDLTKIEIEQLPDFDILAAGFPCQTFSIMGQRKGFEDARGQIIYHLIGILKGKNIPYFILENVKGLINHDSGRSIKTIENAIDEAGYVVNYKVLNSVDHGVPQMRERVYFVGIRKDRINSGDFSWPAPVKTPSIENYLCDERSEILDENDYTFQKYLHNKYNIGQYKINDILKENYLVLDTRQSDLRLYRGRVPTMRTGRHGILYVMNGKLHKLSGYESLLLQGFEKASSWKVSQKIAESDILSQAGNAMTVTVIAQLAKALLKYMEGSR